MNTLDEIPYYTNENSQLFAWYSIYANQTLVEYNRFTTIRFNDIPKHNVLDFGLYGMGFHLNTNLTNGIFTIQTSNKSHYSINYTLGSSLFSINNMKLYNSTPFELKGYDYDYRIDDTSNNISYTSKFYGGYNGTILLDNQFPINVKAYYSIDAIHHPRQLAVIYKIIPINNIQYPDREYYIIRNEISNSNKQTTEMLSSINLLKNKRSFRNMIVINL